MKRTRIVSFVMLATVLLYVVVCGGKKEGVAGNTPPEITEVTLLPLNPSIGSEISVRISAMDKEGDPLTYKVKWFVNGKEIGEGMSFKYEEAKMGDKVFAEVTPFDGKEWGKAVRSREVTLGGLPPRIVSVNIIPESLFVHTPRIVVSATAEDPDGDSIQIFVYWMLNDDRIPDSSNVLDLTKLKPKKNDRINGGVVAFDGQSKSEPFMVELEIANSPPVFSTRIDSVVASPESLYYRVPIMDPDGDKLTFELLDAPPGVKVDRNTGVIYGSAGDVKTFEVSVRATDTDGAYLDARFTLTAP
ncbi:MAG: putative Ig domain-containing protein [candidate division WOR-3 bacterium]